ncbi:helix-turn-helix domain-containing protein [Pyxidicoccus sp. 3LFB2]
METRAGYGRAVWGARKRHKLTQADVAQKLGVSASFISKVESGAIWPSPRVAAGLSKLVGVVAPGVDATPVAAEPGVGYGIHEQFDLGLTTTTKPDRFDSLLPIERSLGEEGSNTVQWDIPQTISELSYLTHNFFRYYGKFPPSIPKKLIRDFRPAKSSIILDNYSGSGTTLVEAKLEGYGSIGVDISPLGALAGRVKTRHHNLKAVTNLARRITEMVPTINAQVSFDPKTLKALGKWFEEETVQQLMNLKTCILELPVTPEREFISLAFVSIIRRVSRAYDGEVRPHINPSKKSRDVYEAFVRKIEDMLGRAEEFQRATDPRIESMSICASNQNLSLLLSKSRLPVGLVISHPPYLNCFDYAPVYKLEYLWAQDLDPTVATKYENIRKSETRCWPATDRVIYDSYFAQLKRAYEQVALVSERGVRCCIVIGDCTISGKVVPVLDLLTESLEEVGFQLEKTVYRTTHYGTGKYAYASRADYHSDGAVKRDGVLIFKKR